MFQGLFYNMVKKYAVKEYHTLKYHLMQCNNDMNYDKIHGAYEYHEPTGTVS